METTSGRVRERCGPFLYPHAVVERPGLVFDEVDDVSADLVAVLFGGSSVCGLHDADEVSCDYDEDESGSRARRVLVKKRVGSWSSACGCLVCRRPSSPAVKVP